MKKQELVEDLYVLYGGTMLRIAMRYVSKEVALDLVQDCFLKLMEMELPGITEKEQWKYYLIRMIQNKGIDYIRREKKHGTWSYVDTWDEPLTEPEDLPLERIVIEEEAGQLALCIEQLDDIYKTVLYLYYYENVKLKKIGKLLGITSQAAGMRLSRGRKQLREDLKDLCIRND